MYICVSVHLPVCVCVRACAYICIHLCICCVPFCICMVILIVPCRRGPLYSGVVWARNHGQSLVWNVVVIELYAYISYL